LQAAADQGYIDEVIRPEETRSKVISALKNLAGRKTKTPWKKHDNLPL
jgi:propionyl-CoA carboxylase beta chain